MSAALASAASGFLGAECSVELLERLNVGNTECLSLLVSKMLGVGIVAGAMGVKLPQILKIVNAGSGAGVSALAHVLELVNMVIAITYSYRVLGLEFNTYGEYVFISLQNCVILYLLFRHGEAPGGIAGFFGFAAVYAGVLYAMLGPQAVALGLTDGVVQQMQNLTIPIMLFGRVPQILQTWRNKSAGQLALTTWLLNFAGATARVFTTMKEAGGDVTLLAGFVIAATLNGTIMAQILIYGNAPAPGSAADAKKRN